MIEQDGLDGRAVELAAEAHAENQKLRWHSMTEAQKRRRIRAMYVAIRAYRRAEDERPGVPQ